MSSRVEDILQNAIDGGSGQDLLPPESRVEAILQEKYDGPPESRVEDLLMAIDSNFLPPESRVEAILQETYDGPPESRVEELLMQYVGGNLVEYSVTGNPATFTTDVARELTAFTIPFTPIQSGSGDPSPDNVRPITGITGLTVYHSGADTSAPTTYAVTFPVEAGTVYCGELNVVTGVLTVTHGCITFNGSENWGKASNVAYFLFTSMKRGSWYTDDAAKCDKFTKEETVNVVKSYPTIVFGNNSTMILIANVFGILPNVTDAATFKTWLSNNNVTITYPLATEQSYQLDPISVKTLIGINTVWSDTNGTNSITYLKKE